MAKVNICNVVVLDNPSPFANPFQFEITFECTEDLKEDLEWKIIYVGSAESEAFDQVLDTVLVGPLMGGRHKFVFQADAPDTSRIPVQDAVGVTVVLLTCGYKGQEFIRVGYYVNNEYDDPEFREIPPAIPDFNKLQRNVLATCPRVTRFRIDWGDGPPPSENEENVAPSFNTESESNQMSEPFYSMNKVNELTAASTGLNGLSDNLFGCSTTDIRSKIPMVDAFKNMEESSMDL